ncbi:synaptotagmin-like protein 2 isoform X2 [Parambassis ranga]|uniref:Synaptotagmin-like protein 2 n=1 Tax=Parambassis ranga TaxID=210632 RepID=A0A6P7JEJ2_9TELE|nr:synaptotagmin-like protein 2 isoform X2 [Parambassis ranga]
MIDLSHLTEEEQGAIMTVLRRDADLKKAEEERIRKLEKILDSSTQSDSNLKYLTGEWFYEAKSRRHMDKIHGSEIILASMKQGKTGGSEGSLRTDRSRTSSSRGSDVLGPPKPARCLEALQPQETKDADKENLNSGIRSPRTPRHNPFNRASLIVVEPPENNYDLSSSRDRDTKETEPASSLKNPPAGEAAQTSGSITSEGSSVGFRPVPKKRTFLSRRKSSQSEINGLGLDAHVGPAEIVPAPRRSLQRGSSSSSNQSGLKHQDETPQKCAVTVSNQIAQSVQPSRPADDKTPQTHSLHEVSQVSPNTSLEKETNTASIPRDRQAVFSRTEREATQRSEDDTIREQTQREHAALSIPTATTTTTTPTFQDNSSVGMAVRQEELSLPQSTVDPDPPMSYDLHFVDKPDQHNQKSNQKHAFKLSTQATSPTGEEGDSIAKVLDWFSRSTDSSDWLKTEDTAATAKHVEVSKSREEDLSAKYAVDAVSDRKKETSETKRSHLQRQTNEEKEFRATDRTISKEVTETQAEKKHLQDGKDNVDENQPPKISHLKSFWEKSTPGPKILIGKSVPQQKPVEFSDSITTSVPGTCSVKAGHDKEENPLTDHVDSHLNNLQQVNNVVINSTPKNNNGSSPQTADRRGSDAEILCVTRLSSSTRPTICPESENVKPVPPPDSASDVRDPPVLLQEELSKTMLQLDPDLQPRCSPDSRNDVQLKEQNRRGSSEDVRRRDSEDKSVTSKRKDDASSKERTNGPHSNRQGLPHQESTAERIKQLKSFWEQERNKPVFYTGKPKAPGDGKVARGANQAKLNNRFTKSEYDLRSIGNDSGSDEEQKNHPNFTILPLNQRLDKTPQSLSTSRTQFNTLREFWDEATSDSRAPFSFDKPKTPKRKESLGGQLPSQEIKSGDLETYRLSTTVEKTRPAGLKSSQNRSQSPHDRQTGSRTPTDSKNNLPNYMSAEGGQQRQTRRSSKDASREEKPTKPQGSSGKEVRSPKSRKDSFGTSSGRENSLRRATSMFALSIPDEKDQNQLTMDISPVHSQSRKQRLSTDKGAMLRRASEDSETLIPRARAFVPRDYRHYLGMTDKTSVHTSLAPTAKNTEPEIKSGYELDLGCPVRTSTPVSSEDRYGRKAVKTNQQRPLWANYSGSDTGQESSVSSTSETWCNSRNSSNRENEDDDLNPVRKALRRAEARPKNMAKSMEDITASLSPRQERRPDPTADLRRSSDASSIPSPSSSLFSDPDHLKKMSKSVPSFLQKEDAGRDTDYIYEDSYHRGRLMTGSSGTNINSSSGMASVSSLSGSVMTMYSGDFGSVEVQGNIHFSINYVQRLREFHIFVSECRDLAAVDPKRGRSDPYVKSYLAPDKANLGKRKTSVKKKTLNPTFNEILRYRVRMEYLRTQTLILSVWHHDTFGRNSFLGEVDVDLSKWDFDHTQMNYLALKARTTPTLELSNGRGEMRLAIRFLPQITHSEGVVKDSPNSGEIHIWVKDCKNLPLIRATLDPYVKCFVLPDTSRKSRQKTRVLRRTVDPVFNHTMVYDGIREADLTEACVELTVWDRDRLASNLLGGLRLGTGTGRSYGALVDWMDSGPYEVALWERMMAAPNEWVEGVLPLRMLNSAKTAFK